MFSPFSTIEEFEGAIDGPTGGAIYTFAHSPALNAVALVICVALFIWFLVKTFAAPHGVPTADSSLNHLSAFIVAGLVSLAGAEYRQPSQPAEFTVTQSQAIAHRPRAKSALGLLGLAGVGLPAGLRRKSSARKGRYRDIKSSR